MNRAGLVRVVKRVRRVREGRVQTYTQHYYVRPPQYMHVERYQMLALRHMESSIATLREPNNDDWLPNAHQTLKSTGYQITRKRGVSSDVWLNPASTEFRNLRKNAIDYITRIHQLIHDEPRIAARVIESQIEITLAMLTLLGDQPAEFWAHYGATDAIDFYLRHEQHGIGGRSLFDSVIPALLNAVCPVPATPDKLQQWQTPFAQAVAHYVNTYHVHLGDRIAYARHYYNNSFNTDIGDYEVCIRYEHGNRSIAVSLSRGYFGQTHAERRAFVNAWKKPLQQFYDRVFAEMIDTIYRKSFQETPSEPPLTQKLASNPKRYFFPRASHSLLEREYARRRRANPDLYQWAESILFHSPYQEKEP